MCPAKSASWRRIHSSTIEACSISSRMLCSRSCFSVSSSVSSARWRYQSIASSSSITETIAWWSSRVSRVRRSRGACRFSLDMRRTSAYRIGHGRTAGEQDLPDRGHLPADVDDGGEEAGDQRGQHDADDEAEDRREEPARWITDRHGKSAELPVISRYGGGDDQDEREQLVEDVENADQQPVHRRIILSGGADAGRTRGLPGTPGKQRTTRVRSDARDRRRAVRLRRASRRRADDRRRSAPRAHRAGLYRP